MPTSVEKLSIALTAEQAAMVRAAVASGDYASTSEVIREALRLWRQVQEERRHARDELRQLWEEGLASGPSRDGPEVLARLRARYAEPAE